MQNRLGQYVPERETLAAGIHVVNKELHIFRYYQNCVPEGDKLYWLDDVEPKVLQANRPTPPFSGGVFIVIIRCHLPKKSSTNSYACASEAPSLLSSDTNSLISSL